MSGVTTGENRGRPTQRLVLIAVAAVVVVVAAVVLVLRTTGDTSSSPPGAFAPAQLRNIVWRDPHSVGTVVYTGTTIRTYDGCQARLSRLIIRDNRLIEGSTLSPDGACSGLGAPQSREEARARQLAQNRLARFYRFIRGPTMWTRVRNVLVLETPRLGTLRLMASGPAPTLTGTKWHLVDFRRPRIGDRDPSAPLSLSVTPRGTFRFALMCGAVEGRAQVAATSIQFSEVKASPCTDPTSIDITSLVEAGSAQYSIAGDELIIDTRTRLLIYKP